MAFVNEYIPDEDVEKYGLAEIDSKCWPANHSRDWTIDRERNIYLREVTTPHREATENTYEWTFFWKGELLWFKRTGLGIEKKSDGLRHAHSRITDFVLPTHLKPKWQEIYQDLCDAFRTYGGGGVFSKSTDYVHDLDFIENGEAE